MVPDSWCQPDRSGDAGRHRPEGDRSTVAPADAKSLAWTAERIAGLAGRDHEQAAVQVGEVIDAAIGRAVHRLKPRRSVPPRSSVVSSPGLGMLIVVSEPSTGMVRSNGCANTAWCAFPQRHAAGSAPKRALSVVDRVGQRVAQHRRAIAAAPMRAGRGQHRGDEVRDRRADRRPSGRRDAAPRCRTHPSRR